MTIETITRQVGTNFVMYCYDSPDHVFERIAELLNFWLEITLSFESSVGCAVEACKNFKEV